jgi:hypothetical protein
MTQATEVFTSETRIEKLRRQKTSIWAITSCLVVLICIVWANPFNEAGFNDDWCYRHTAIELAQTGYLHYNGWGNPMILFQTLWALPWIWLFGASAQTLAASMVPISLGFVLIVYAVGRQIGLRPSVAAFGSLVLGTSPLFVTLAGTFMTDICGGFFSMLCIYTALRSADRNVGPKATRWVWWLTLAGVVGGANRQIVWIAPLTLIPYLCWVHRADSRFRAHAAAAYGICIAAILALLHYFGQPFTPMQVAHDEMPRLFRREAGYAAGMMAPFALLAILLAAPAASCLLYRLRTKNVRSLLFLLVITVGFTFGEVLLGYSIVPYGNSIMTAWGPIMLAEDALARPPFLPLWPRVALTCFVNFCLFTVLFGSRRRGWVRDLRRDRTLHVFLIFSLGYVALLVPGALTRAAYDRYILPVLPVLVLELLRRFSWARRAVPVYAWIFLGLIGQYAVASTHDYFAALRARTAAANRLESAGIPRRHISAAFEYDGWTQVSRWGHVRVERYADHFLNCYDKGYWLEFWNHTPDFRPEFVVLNEQLGRGLFSVPFHAWLPPHDRSVVVWRRSDLNGVLAGVSVLFSCPKGI